MSVIKKEIERGDNLSIKQKRKNVGILFIKIILSKHCKPLGKPQTKNNGTLLEKKIFGKTEKGWESEKKNLSTEGEVCESDLKMENKALWTEWKEEMMVVYDAKIMKNECEIYNCLFEEKLDEYSIEVKFNFCRKWCL